MSRSPVVGVGVVVFRDREAREVLLVKRGKPPAEGLWSPPGGRIEWGETVAEAAQREVFEECSLRVRVPDNAAFTSVDVLGAGAGNDVQYHFVLVEVVALCRDDREPRAGDDAADCRWWPVHRLPDAQPQVGELPRIVGLARKRLLNLVEWPEE
jgi:8-oxo-dGTP diphosphatase